LPSAIHPHGHCMRVQWSSRCFRQQAKFNPYRKVVVTMVSTAVKSLESAKAQLLAKISGLENEVKQIESVITALAGLESGEVVEAVQQIMVVEAAAPVASGKRVISAATKAKMKKAQQARWAKINAVKASSTSVVSEVSAKPAKKKKMSPLGKLKIKLGALNRYGKTAEAKKVKAQIAALEAK